MASSPGRYTGKDLVQQLMKSMAMTVPTTVAGSTDKRTTQFWQLATDAGQQLAMEYAWQQLTTTMSILGNGTDTIFPLPLELGIVNDASWNRTTRQPLIGSLTEQEWEMVVARSATGATFNMLFRVASQAVEFLVAPPSGEEIYLPLRGRGWVDPAATPGSLADVLVEDDDIVLLEPLLFKAKLKLLWYEAKQFDTSKIQKQYETLLAIAKANDVPGRILTLAQPSRYPLIGAINVPDTGFGS